MSLHHSVPTVSMETVASKNQRSFSQMRYFNMIYQISVQLFYMVFYIRIDFFNIVINILIWPADA